VIVDYDTVKRAKDMKIDIQEYIDNYDGYGIFKKLGKEIFYTGPTGSNVSDILMLYKPE
jgi:glycerate-2-kinase